MIFKTPSEACAGALGHLAGAVVLPVPALAGRRGALLPYRGRPLVMV